MDVGSLRSLLYGGRDAWETHARIVRVMQADPAFNKSRRLYMTRTERYERALAMTRRIYELKDQESWSDEETKLATRLVDENIPMTLHDLAFEPVFFAQASPSLISRYGPLIQHRGILGCYLQTELAHGTNVSALETTATYIPETQEFDIHSPTLTSSKWWIGALGKTATHGVLQARLILPGGKDHGPHLFFLQLRSLEDHKPLPGISIGDIGPKAMAGYASTDNGYARFEHVRIPRDNMLSKFAGVTPEGEYIKPPHAKMSYGGMMYIRAHFISSCGWVMAKAATVSIRYSTVRRQGNPDAVGLEQQVVSYPSVQHRLLPILARAYVFILLGRRLLTIFADTTTRLASGDISTLADMHALTSALKSLATRHAVRDLEDARRAMGGHGYSAYAGLGRVYAEQLPLVTAEGDNYVLDKQVFRAALKAFERRDNGDRSVSAEYLRVVAGAKTPQMTPASWESFEALVLLLQWRAAKVVEDRAKRGDLDEDASADQRVATAVAEAIVAAQLGAIGSALQLKPREREIMRDLLRLYLLITTEAALVDLMSFGLVSAAAARELRTAIAKLFQPLLVEAIGLTDAFGFTDWELDSALGVYDGNVYEALWQKVQTEPLNQTEVTQAYKEHIRPLLERGWGLAVRSKL